MHERTLMLLCAQTYAFLLNERALQLHAPVSLQTILAHQRVCTYITTCTYTDDSMPTNAKRQRHKRKVSRTFRLTPGKLEEAQKILGTDTATATIEQALDLVVFREELVQGAIAMRGAEIERVD